MNKTIEETFIDRILPSMTLYSKRDSGAHRFACPFCQSNGIDRKGKKIPAYKATGFLYRYENTNAWNFKCHKCGERLSFEKFLEQQFPLLHFEYVRLRDQLGTTGFQTNCPSLETMLKKRGVLGNPPEFRPQRVEQEVQRPVVPPVEPVQQVHKSVAPTSLPGNSCKKSVPTGFKLTIEPPMRSPQQQAGKQSGLNYLMNQRAKRRREREGW
jgi:hypothetical protein